MLVLMPVLAFLKKEICSQPGPPAPCHVPTQVSAAPQPVNNDAMLCSDGSGASSSDALLHSPPRQWPKCFKESAPLKRFLGKILKGTRCRLTDEPPTSVLTEAIDVKISATDSAANAERVHAELDWAVVTGYALFEKASSEGVFVAEKRSWNEHKGAWVDLTPRPPAHTQIVLVESAVTPAAVAAAIASATARVPSKPAIDVSDATSTVPPTPTPQAPPAAAPPKAAATKPKKKPSASKASVVGMWRSVSTVRDVPVGEKGYDGYQKTKRVPFPGPNADVRMELREDGTFELEARRWGKGFDGRREGVGEFAPRSETELFAPLEYGAKEAAALHVSGAWLERDFGECHFLVTKVEEHRNGEADPPSAPPSAVRTRCVGSVAWFLTACC